MDEATRQDGRPVDARAPRLEDERAEDGARVLPRPGDVVGGKYRIEKVVGRGGMGVVYLAHHLVLDQRVALKLLLVDPAQGNDTVERFLREAQAAARLRSDHVVRVMDAGALDTGHPYLAMEYLEGCDLAELLSLEGPQPYQETADYMLQALAALAQAHTAGIVHRDLKPANLFLAVREDKSNILKILDFGISKQKGDRSHLKDLTGQAVLGTPVYMSPEQLRSSKNVDPRADLWSLGVVMYELLTGEVPFDGDGPGEVFAAVLEKTPSSPRTHRPDLSAEWEHVVMRCLQRNPDERWQNAGEMARALVPLGTGRWSHLATGIRQALSRPSMMPKDGIALMAAAVAAARASILPPAKTSTRDPEAPTMGPTFPPLDYAGPLAGTVPIPGAMGVPISAASPVAGDRTQFASVAPIPAKPSPAKPSRPRAVHRPMLIAAAVLFATGVVFTKIHAKRVRVDAAAARMAAAAVESARAPAPSPSAQMGGDELGHSDPPAASLQAEPQAAASSAAPASSAPEPPKPPAVKASPIRRHTPDPAKRSPTNSRPKFLKSWN